MSTMSTLPAGNAVFFGRIIRKLGGGELQVRSLDDQRDFPAYGVNNHAWKEGQIVECRLDKAATFVCWLGRASLFTRFKYWFK